MRHAVPRAYVEGLIAAGKTVNALLASATRQLFSASGRKLKMEKSTRTPRRRTHAFGIDTWLFELARYDLPHISELVRTASDLTIAATQKNSLFLTVLALAYPCMPVQCSPSILDHRGQHGRSSGRCPAFDAAQTQYRPRRAEQLGGHRYRAMYRCGSKKSYRSISIITVFDSPALYT